MINDNYYFTDGNILLYTCAIVSILNFINLHLLCVLHWFVLVTYYMDYSSDESCHITCYDPYDLSSEYTLLVAPKCKCNVYVWINDRGVGTMR